MIYATVSCASHTIKFLGKGVAAERLSSPPIPQTLSGGLQGLLAILRLPHITQLLLLLLLLPSVLYLYFFHVKHFLYLTIMYSSHLYLYLSQVHHGIGTPHFFRTRLKILFSIDRLLPPFLPGVVFLFSHYPLPGLLRLCLNPPLMITVSINIFFL